MDGPIAGATVFTCLFSSAVAGVVMHARMPGHSLPLGARNVMHRSIAIIAAMAGVLLVMLTLTQKAAFDHTDRDVKRFSAQLIQLDHTLRRAGPQADTARDLLFRYAVHAMQQIWPDGNMVMPRQDLTGPPPLGLLENAIASLSQDTPVRREVVTDAQRILRDASQTNWALAASGGDSGSPYLVAVVLFWLMVTFASFGLCAPLGRAGCNVLVITALFLSAIALGGAMFLLQEYNDPFSGYITVAHEPLQAALFAISE